MSELRDWLCANNPEQYFDAFEANDVDLEILPDLDEHDLEQLGLSFRRGDRRAAGRGHLRASRHVFIVGVGDTGPKQFAKSADGVTE